MRIKVISNQTGYSIPIGEEMDAVINPNTGQAVVFTKDGMMCWLDKAWYEITADHTKPSTPHTSLTEMLGGSIKTLQVEFK